MDVETERETHELVLAVIFQGRLQAQEWREVGLVPQGSTRPFVLGLLDSLGERRGLDDIDEDRIELVGEQIRRFTNSYREGLSASRSASHSGSSGPKPTFSIIRAALSSFRDFRNDDISGSLSVPFEKITLRRWSRAPPRASTCQFLIVAMPAPA
ncbi:MAG: hypothetical protein ACRBBS_12885 [Thalassovita sp.]